MLHNQNNYHFRVLRRTRKVDNRQATIIYKDGGERTVPVYLLHDIVRLHKKDIFTYHVSGEH